MTDLRAVLIEAGARAWVEYESDDWDAMGPKPQQALIEAIERIFDAFLDTLSDRAVEWMSAAWDIAMKQNPPHKDHEANLIAALRGDT